MAQHTGGHHLDTGAGPKPIGLASGNASEGAAQTAYRAYIEHRPGCGQCRGGDTLQCPVADSLWQAYKEARA